MKKVFTLSLMISGLAGAALAGSSTLSHKADINTTSSTKNVKIEKNQKVAWIPLPEDGNSHKPC